MCFDSFPGLRRAKAHGSGKGFSLALLPARRLGRRFQNCVVCHYGGKAFETLVRSQATCGRVTGFLGDEVGQEVGDLKSEGPRG